MGVWIRKPMLRQFLAAFAATLGVFGLGTVLAWTSPALPDMEASIHSGSLALTLTDELKSWIGSTAVLGAMAATPFAGFASDRLGRRLTMLLIAPMFVLGWLVIALSSLTNSNGSTLALLLVGRFITGFCGGTFSLAAPIYISETADDSVRGAMSNLFQLMLVSGILFTYVVGSFVKWWVLALVSAGVPIAALVVLVFVPESPRFLMMRGKKDEAEAALQWLREGSAVQMELDALEASLEQSRSLEGKLAPKDFLRGPVLKPILIVLSLMVFEQLSGYNAIIFYVSTIFQASGSQLNPNMCSIIVGAVQVVATVASGIFVDRAGRRLLLLLGQVLMAIPLVVLGFYFQFNKNDGTLSSLGWLPIVCLVLFIIAFSLGIGPLSWTMLGELLAPNVKGVCSSIAVALVWLSAFVVTKTFTDITGGLGIAWCFWLYAITCAVGFVSIWMTVPETKGKSLEEIQELFK